MKWLATAEEEVVVAVTEVAEAAEAVEEAMAEDFQVRMLRLWAEVVVGKVGSTRACMEEPTVLEIYWSSSRRLDGILSLPPRSRAR